MGLDFRGSDAHWSYGGFHRFRARLAMEVGIDLENMQGFGGKQISWDGVYDPLKWLLSHSDCDGEMSPKECEKVYPRLREIIGKWPDDDYDKIQATRLADGMENCALDDKPLIFR